MKRKNIRTAGRLVSGVVYTVAHPSDTEAQRAAKTNVSTAAREKMNLRYSWQKLELLLAANFTYKDLHVILTYDEANLPPNREEARKQIKKFIRLLREKRKADHRGVLKYVYNVEGNHGNKRFHHHMVINAVGKDFAEISGLWEHGHVDFELVGVVGYTKLAMYLTKEPKDGIWSEVGERSWVPSLGLTHPTYDKGNVPDNYSLTVPPGAVVLLNEYRQNEFGEFHFIKYLTPEPRPDWPNRHHRKASKTAQS